MGKARENLPPGGLSPLELHAGACFFGKEAPKWRDVLEIGDEQQADFMFWLRATVDVGAQTFRIVNALPERLDLLAFVYRQLTPKPRARLHHDLLAAFAAGRRPDLDPEARHLATLALERITTSEQRPQRGAVRLRSCQITRLPRSAASYKNKKGQPE